MCPTVHSSVAAWRCWQRRHHWAVSARGINCPFNPQHQLLSHHLRSWSRCLSQSWIRSRRAINHSRSRIHSWLLEGSRSLLWKHPLYRILESRPQALRQRWHGKRSPKASPPLKSLSPNAMYLKAACSPLPSSECRHHQAHESVAVVSKGSISRSSQRHLLLSKLTESLPVRKQTAVTPGYMQ